MFIKVQGHGWMTLVCTEMARDNDHVQAKREFLSGLDHTVPIAPYSVFSPRAFPATPGPFSFVCDLHGYQAVIATSTYTVAKAAEHNKCCVDNECLRDLATKCALGGQGQTCLGQGILHTQNVCKHRCSDGTTVARSWAQLLMMLCVATPRQHCSSLAHVVLRYETWVYGNLMVFRKDYMERATGHM